LKSVNAAASEWHRSVFMNKHITAAYLLPVWKVSVHGVTGGALAEISRTGYICDLEPTTEEEALDLVN